MNDAVTLFQRYKDPVYRLALSMTGSPADAEDVCQTVFLKLLEKRPALDLEKERAWLLQVTANECRSLWRRLRRRPRGDQAVLYLHYYEGFSTQEVGEMLRISRSAVTTRLLRARKKLKDILEEDCQYEA